MFDIGMLEIMIILVITLLVIGPERMPEVARKIGQFVGKTKRFVHSVRDNSELNDTVKEIQNSMNIEQERQSLDQIKNSMQTDFAQIEKDLKEQENITRPFGEIDEVSPSQFNQAPTQPQPPQTTDEHNAPEATPSVASDSTQPQTKEQAPTNRHDGADGHGADGGAKGDTQSNDSDAHPNASQKQGQP